MRQVLREHASASAPIAAAVARWLAARPGLRTVALYAALPGEVDLATLAADTGRAWVYPRVDGHGLEFHRVENPAADLLPGAFGILEPSPSLPEVAIADIDVFLCPGLAFDSLGGRLGRGRGFYDRILARASPESMKIGVCHPFQIVPDTFPEPHDIRMDLVISG